MYNYTNGAEKWKTALTKFIDKSGIPASSLEFKFLVTASTISTARQCQVFASF